MLYFLNLLGGRAYALFNIVSVLLDSNLFEVFNMEWFQFKVKLILHGSITFHIMDFTTKMLNFTVCF